MVDQRLHQLSPEAWRRVDQELEALLEMDAGAQADRLQVLARSYPQDVPILHALLNAEGRGRPLDEHLLTALSYLAGQALQAPGSRIGPWQLVRPIGRGGMA